MTDSEEDPRRIAAALPKAHREELLSCLGEFVIGGEREHLVRAGLLRRQRTARPPCCGFTPLGLSVAKALKEMENG